MVTEVGRGKGMGVTPLEVGRGEGGPDGGGGRGEEGAEEGGGGLKVDELGRGTSVGDCDGM